MSGLWTWLNDNGVGVNAVAVVVTAAVAVVALSRTAKDSRERTRPYVLVEYQRIPYVPWTLAVVVRNAGQTVASDVRVLFDDLGTGVDQDESLVACISRRYQRILPALAPGQLLSNSVRTQPTAPEEDRLPDIVTATVSYRYGHRRYKGTFVLDTRAYDEEVSSRSSDSPEGRLKSIGDAVKSLTAEVAKINGTLGKSSIGK